MNKKQVDINNGFFREIKTNKILYLMALPGILFFLIFSYVPMCYLIIGFKDYSPALGVIKSPWIGFEHFINFFNGAFFWRVIKNTVGLSLYALATSFWIPIIFALLLNEMRCIGYKRVVQTITYIPNFVSTVVICGMITNFTMESGIINDLIAFLGGSRSNLLMRPELFKTIYVVSGIWQSMGWMSIVYVAALTSIDPTLYEAAEIDGAKRLKQIIYITIPGILPTIVTMFILNVGTIMSVGFEKVLLLYNPITYETADVISTYVYRKGLVEMNFSFATAISLFNSVINLILVIVTNYISKKITETALW